MMYKHVSPSRSLPLLLSLLLTLLLAACGGSTPSSTPSSSNGSNSATTTSGNGTIAPSDMEDYQGKYYTISYPKDWQKTITGDTVTFTSPQKGYLAVSTIANPNGITPVSTIITSTVNGLRTTFPNNFTEEQIPATTTINGTTWTQGEITGGTNNQGAQHNIKEVVMGTNHPQSSPNTQLFLVIYAADPGNFDQLVTADFEPMLTSLKLTN